ncbi:site-specific DNA-methyltransferase [Photobacterium carnosum]|uniref:site-specific DNA-methyltransferase n=1 Tax=Photobacterium carnosum TaxID=2023717 RepID=UPI001E291046|nr:site-specific DNA-methyltransferase [Photobacterium carnosum]MCD9553959.1 site-specific DNA-methyltransferase [Photobacterium carnosum]
MSAIEKITGSSPEAKSLDITQQNIEQLKQLFPDIFSENKIDFEALRAVLGEEIDDSEERYNFTWNGKTKARQIAQTPSTGTLRPCKEESVNWDTTENLFIEGDNLEVLKLLQKSYHKQVKMIYIDPPYNTGKDFVYKDNFHDNIKNYLDQTGQIDEVGNKLSTNSDTSGRYHSSWLNMIFPRIKLAKNLLSDDGCIFISIDDSEVTNLIKICNEIFGEDNFINQISVKAKPSAGASGGGEDLKLKKNVEYLLCYCKNRSTFPRFNDVYESQSLFSYIKEYKDSGKSWKYTRVLTSFGNKRFFKDIKDGSGENIKIYSHEDVVIETIPNLAKKEGISEEDIYAKYFDKIFRDTNAQSSIRQRVLDATDTLDTFYSIEYIPTSGRNKNKLTTLYYKGRNKDIIAWLSDVAIKDGKKLFKKDKVGTLWSDFNWNNVSKEGDIQYPNGKKPIAFIKRMIELTSSSTKDDIILDFFAGSGSTAHAVADQNDSDGGTRKSISVQLPELIDSKDKKKLYSSESLSHINTISDLSIERLKRSFKSYGDIGFMVFKLADTNIRKWDADFDNLELVLQQATESIKEDRSSEDVLYEIFLKYGYDLTTPVEIETVNGKQVFVVGAGALIVCLDDDITGETVEGIAKLKEELDPETTQVVFKDAGFADSNVKTNAIQILKQAGIDDVKSI